MTSPAILVADNDAAYLETTCEYLRAKGYEVISVSNPLAAKKIIKQVPLALAILDYRLLNDDDENDKSGLQIAQDTINLNVPKIILTKIRDYRYAIDSLKPGRNGAPAVNFIMKQDGLEKLLEAIEQVLVENRIFLCYAKPDLKKIIKLYDNLTAAGFNPWMDKKHLLGGEKWELAIRKTIRSSDFFIVCLSSNSVNRRGYMQKEIKIALDIWEEKLDDDIFLIPVRLEECEISNQKLLELQWVDLYKPDGFSKLVKAVQMGKLRVKKKI